MTSIQTMYHYVPVVDVNYEEWNTGIKFLLKKMAGNFEKCVFSWKIRIVKDSKYKKDKAILECHKLIHKWQAFLNFNK